MGQALWTNPRRLVALLVSVVPLLLLPTLARAADHGLLNLYESWRAAPGFVPQTEIVRAHRLGRAGVHADGVSGLWVPPVERTPVRAGRYARPVEHTWRRTTVSG